MISCFETLFYYFTAFRLPVVVLYFDLQINLTSFTLPELLFCFHLCGINNLPCFFLKLPWVFHAYFNNFSLILNILVSLKIFSSESTFKSLCYGEMPKTAITLESSVSEDTYGAYTHCHTKLSSGTTYLLPMRMLTTHVQGNIIFQASKQRGDDTRTAWLV